MFVFTVFFIFVCSASGFRRLPPEQCEVRVRTDAGEACGLVRVAEAQHKYASFRGLPYAEPPVGQRRFGVPEPVKPWGYLLDATEDGPACPQKDLIYGRISRQPRGQSKDCLYMNVHVPYSHFPTDESCTNRSSGLPVVVMVHGGGFQTGSGLTDLHGPAYLITTGSVIVISFNYRLNVFGYLSLGTAKVPGNQALRDVLAALRWVQRNARAFGGDPDNVTLMGQSAGASMVHLLALSKAAEGLFHRVIMMSGHAIPNYFSTSPRFAEQIATDFLQHLGINSTDPECIHEALTTMPLVDIMYANSIIQYGYGLTSFVPVEEGVYYGVERVVEDNPLRLLAKAQGNQYPMLLGYTSDEAEFFKWLSYVWQMPQRVQNNPALTLPLRIAYAYPDDVETLANRTAERCFHGDYSLENFVNCFSYLFFKYPILKIAEWRALGGAPTYLYRYSYESQRSILKEAVWTTYEGAAHVEDLTYIFRVDSLLGDLVSFPPKNNDDRMKLWWVTTVTNFAKCNNPTCTEDEAQWPPVDGEPLEYQDISRPMEYHMKTPDAAEADWLRYYAEIDTDVRNVATELRRNLDTWKNTQKD